MKIRNKIYVIVGIPLISFLLIGIISIYLINSIKASTVLLEAVRVHNESYYKGMRKFNRYLVNRDGKAITDAIEPSFVAQHPEKYSDISLEDHETKEGSFSDKEVASLQDRLRSLGYIE